MWTSLPLLEKKMAHKRRGRPGKQICHGAAFRPFPDENRDFSPGGPQWYPPIRGSVALTAARRAWYSIRT
ncbi:hypothetical protein Elgi_51270 [Paenibacillus elgii]|nr:hypothetical protein Elgi_51270 [Paenibacillus elgii]